MKTRVEHIDVAKGISIVLVAMLHSKLITFYADYIAAMSLFRMPLFFFLAGVFFSWKASAIHFLYNKSHALLKPYFIVLLLLLLLHVAIGNTDVISEAFGLFYSSAHMLKWGPLWFLTHLFVVFVFCFFLFRCFDLSNKSFIFSVIFLFLMMMGGIRFIDFSLANFWHKEIMLFEQSIILYGLPFSFDLVLISSSFFILGRLLKENIIQLTFNFWLFCLAIAIFIAIAAFTDAYIDLYERIYTSAFFATLGALLGIYVILSLSCLISRYPALSAIPIYLGKSSLYVLIFHTFIHDKLYPFLSQDINNRTYLILLSITSIAAGVIGSLMIKFLVNNVTSFYKIIRT